MVIGITGGVGSGKSTVLSILERDYGARLLIADEIGHRIMEPGTRAWREIGRIFPECIAGDGRIDRNRLAEIVYADPDRLSELNAIVHPCVREEIQKKLEEWKDSPLIVLETAILFETGCDRFCDQIWGVEANREVRIKRLMESRGYTREKAEGIMCQQMSADIMKEKCHKVINNNENYENLEKEIKYLLGI